MRDKIYYFKKIEASTQLMIESRKQLQERTKLIDQLLNDPNLSTKMVEDAIVKNKIDLSDSEMDLFIKKLSKTNFA